MQCIFPDRNSNSIFTQLCFSMYQWNRLLPLNCYRWMLYPCVWKDFRYFQSATVEEVSRLCVEMCTHVISECGRIPVFQVIDVSSYLHMLQRLLDTGKQVNFTGINYWNVSLCSVCLSACPQTCLSTSISDLKPLVLQASNFLYEFFFSNCFWKKLWWPHYLKYLLLCHEKPSGIKLSFFLKMYKLLMAQVTCRIVKWFRCYLIYFYQVASLLICFCLLYSLLPHLFTHLL